MTLLKSEISPNGDGSYSPLAVEIDRKVQKFTAALLNEYSDRLSAHSIHYLLVRGSWPAVVWFVAERMESNGVQND